MASNYSRRSASSASRSADQRRGASEYSRSRSSSPSPDRSQRSPQRPPQRSPQRSNSDYSRRNPSTSSRPTPARSTGGRGNRGSKKGRGAGFKVLVSLVVVLVLLIGAAVYLVASGTATIHALSIKGSQRFTQEHLAELADIPAGATILTVNVKEIEKRLEADPWIVHADVRRASLSTLSIDVQEAQVAGVVTVQSLSSTIQNARWIISTDGTWLSKVSDDLVYEYEQGKTRFESFQAEQEKAAEGDTGEEASEEDAPENTTVELPNQDYLDMSVCSDVHITMEELDSMIQITDVPRGVTASAGEVTTEPVLLNALEILAGIDKDLKNKMVAISVGTQEAATLILDNNVSVVFGTATVIKEKQILIKQFLEEYEGSISYINVSSVAHPTYRAL